MFFQNEELKTKYQEQIEGVEKDSYEEHLIVGLTLGFPRRSVEVFAKMREYENKTGETSKEEEEYGVGIHWAGFGVQSHLEIVDQEIRWLWDTYNHPKSIDIPLDLWDKKYSSFVKIPYGNFTKLEETIQLFKERRAALPSLVSD
jgi:hypothetical protein